MSVLGNDTLLLCLCAAFPFALPSLIRSHIAFTAVLHLAQQDSQIEKGRYAVRLDNSHKTLTVRGNVLFLKCPFKIVLYAQLIVFHTRDII